VKQNLAAVALFLLTMCASQHAAAPVTVVVTAVAGADQGDATRLQTLAERAIQSRGAPGARQVSVEYFGSASAQNVPTMSQPSQLVIATFTISDAAGHVLHRESLRAKQTSGRLELLQQAAESIADRVRMIGS
jgi:hypothetical protein